MKAALSKLLGNYFLRVEVVGEALKTIDNTSRRDRLLSFLPNSEERILASSEGKSTMWGAVREAMDLIHGNSSFDVPQGSIASTKNKSSPSL
jgi:hypothetical protein